MGVSTYLFTFILFILANPGCFVHSLTRHSLASFDNIRYIERRHSLVVKPRQIRTAAVRIARSDPVRGIARSVPVHVEPVARLHLVDRLKDEERVVPQDHVELVHKDVVKDAVKDVGGVLVAVVVPVAVAPKVAVVVGLLVLALATRISVETVPVALGL
jgi:hypothetical protein